MAIAPGLASVPRRLPGRLVGCLAVLIVTETEAYAFYIDPGSGALLFASPACCLLWGSVLFPQVHRADVFLEKDQEKQGIGYCE